MRQLVEEDIDLHQIDLPNLRRLALSQTVDVSPFELSDGALPISRTVDRATAQLERGTPAFWCVPFFIVSVPRRKIVGSCGFKTAPVQGSVEIHCGVAPGERARGIAKTAIRKLIDLAFSTGIVNEVFACVRPDNMASSKVVDRLGFVAGPLITDPNGEEVVRWSWSQHDNSFDPTPLRDSA
jgi:RimJ/RimL family protein N-acetyltransferase